MAELWKDGFDHYGAGSSGRTVMLEGVYAQVGSEVNPAAPVIPSFGARTGLHALEVNGSATISDSGARRVLPSTKSEVFISHAFRIETLPNAGVATMAGAADVSNNPRVTMMVGTTGEVIVRGPGTRITNDSGAYTAPLLGQSTGPVIEAGTWHHVEVRIVRDDSAGIVEVRVDGLTVLNLTALDLGATDIAQITFGPLAKQPLGSGISKIYFDDVIVRDASGSVNNGFEGDLRVATLPVIANGANQGWTARTIQKLGTGVLSTFDSARDAAVLFDDAAEFDLTDGDFCIEGFWRFAEALNTTQQRVLASKYQTTLNQRSWRLLQNGPDGGGNIVFQVSTDGSAATAANVHSPAWVPEVNRWYHIAVTRAGTTSRLFIDGVQLGADQTDSRSYAETVASLAINGQAASANSAVDDLGVTGWADGFRMTVGAARYTGDFVPPADVLPSTLAGDALYNQVALLLNFDGDINFDQSVNNFTPDLLADAILLTPNDGLAFQNIDDLTPEDNDFILAELLAAIGVLTMPTLPVDASEVVLGSVTYTFVDTLASANDVLIGADAQTSLNNLLAAVNADPGEGTVYGTGTVINPNALFTSVVAGQLVARARAPGAAGNSIASTTDVVGATWTGTTLAGGVDIPPNSEFTVGRLPAEVTGVRSLSVVGRLFKTDAGTSEVTMSFVTQGGSVAAGTARAVTTAPRYYEDIFEQDPSTLGSLTPASVLNARIRVNRTT